MLFVFSAAITRKYKALCAPNILSFPLGCAEYIICLSFEMIKIVDTNLEFRAESLRRCFRRHSNTRACGVFALLSVVRILPWRRPSSSAFTEFLVRSDAYLLANVVLYLAQFLVKVD